MNKIRVGIDVDGVLRNFVGKVVDLAQKEGCSITRPVQWDFIDTHEIDGETIRHKIWSTKEWLEDVFVEAEVIPFGRKGYQKFIEDDRFEVYIVSSQFNGTEELTDRWLEKNGFTEHVRNIYTFNKLEAPCQLLIDDKVSHIEAYHEKVRDGILINREYNMNSRVQPRAENLRDAYNIAVENYKLEEVA